MKNHLNLVIDLRNINVAIKYQNTLRIYGTPLGLTIQYLRMDNVQSHILKIMTPNLLKVKIWPQH